MLGLLDLAQPALFLGASHDGLARGEAVHADVFGRDFRHVVGDDPGEGVHDVQGRQAGALADAEVVEIMRRGDLHRPRPLGRVSILISHNGNTASGDRQGHELADQARIPLILRMHRHARVAQHGLRPGRGDDDEVARLPFRRLAVLVEGDGVFIGDAVRQRIGEMPIGAVHLALLDLQVRDGGLEMRIPVHQPLVAIDQALLVQLHEDLAHGRVQPLVQGEPLARPVARGPQAAQLAHNGAAALGLPFPDLVDEGVAAHVAPPDIARRRQLTLDHHLGRDTGVVRTRQPQHRLALHPVIAGQDVLQGVVQRMADVQAARHIRRRNDDRIGALRPFRAGREQAALFPLGVQAGFGGLGFEGLFEHGSSLIVVVRPGRGLE